jgi:hypothetical protein
MPSGDYSAAQNDMISFANVGGVVEGKTVKAVKKGNAIFALCNYSGNAQGPTIGEITDFNRNIDRSCGPTLFRSGWWHLGGPNKTYWRDTGNAGICCNCKGCSINC